MTVLAATTPNPSTGLVVAMGVGTVFVGLICIIVICYVMGAIIKVFEGRKPAVNESPAPQAAQAAAPAPIENKGELIAVVSAVIAEELGESVEAIRIKSIRKVS